MSKPTLKYILANTELSTIDGVQTWSVTEKLWMVVEHLGFRHHGYEQFSWATFWEQLSSVSHFQKEALYPAVVQYHSKS